MKSLVKIVAFAALFAVVAVPAMAGGDRRDNFSGLSLTESFGGTFTAGRAGAYSSFGGEATSYAEGHSGFDSGRGSGRIEGWQSNDAGARTVGNATGFGESVGASGGVVRSFNRETRPASSRRR